MTNSEFRIQNSELGALAIDGGVPIIPEGPPPWPRPNEAVRQALEEAYADGSWGCYHGPHCQRLRELLAELCGVGHAWLCSSGTIGVELALRGLKIGPGDEVIVGRLRRAELWRQQAPDRRPWRCNYHRSRRSHSAT